MPLVLAAEWRFMKRKNGLIKLLALVAVLVLSIGSLTSCLLWLPSGDDADYMTEDEVRALISGSMGGDVTIDEVNEYDITINNQGQSNLAAATKGVLSAVSVRCSFKVKVGYTDKTVTETSSGAGVIYKLDKTKGDAYVITNYHVVYSANATQNKISNDIKLYLYGMEGHDYSDNPDKYAIPATFVGGSLTEDLAVLKVTGSRTLAESNATAVTFADSNDVSILDTAIAIGNPAAGGISATVGCVNVDGEYVNITGADERTPVELCLLRIDTAVNSGNSGGGLFNDKGELIGIVNAKIVSSDIDNIAYAIRSNAVRAVVENILHYCDGKSAENPYKYAIGIKMQVTGQSTVFDESDGRVHRREVVAVSDVTSGTVAAELFRKGDVINSITINGRTYTINRMFQVIDAMYNVYEGSTLSVSVTRDGETVTVEVPVSQMTLNKVS